MFSRTLICGSKIKNRHYLLTSGQMIFFFFGCKQILILSLSLSICVSKKKNIVEHIVRVHSYQQVLSIIVELTALSMAALWCLAASCTTTLILSSLFNPSPLLFSEPVQKSQSMNPGLLLTVLSQQPGTRPPHSCVPHLCHLSKSKTSVTACWGSRVKDLSLNFLLALCAWAHAPLLALRLKD